jgi:hypothetical protein
MGTNALVVACSGDAVPARLLRYWLRGIAALGVFLLAPLCAEFMRLVPLSVQAADPPNVIVILSDDQGYGDFSRHGNPVLKTPNLDKLAEASARLTDFMSRRCVRRRAVSS